MTCLQSHPALPKAAGEWQTERRGKDRDGQTCSDVRNRLDEKRRIQWEEGIYGPKLLHLSPPPTPAYLPFFREVLLVEGELRAEDLVSWEIQLFLQKVESWLQEQDVLMH